MFGETVKAGGPVRSLAGYYRPGLAIGAEPGTRFRYTDHGFATLGQLVEDVTGSRSTVTCASMSSHPSAVCAAPG